MRIVRLFWTHIENHPDDIYWAAFFGALFAAMFDLASPDSRIRAGIRYLKNLWSQQSGARLQTRIREMEQYRDTLKTYLVSDKAHYLGTLRYMLTVLIFIAIGSAILTLKFILPEGFELIAFTSFAFAIVIGIIGANISSPDYQSRIADMITKADSDINKLQGKLSAL